MKWIKKNLSSIILGLVFFVGLGLLLYPSFSDYWNSFHQSRAIASYAEAVAAIDGVDYEKIWNDAIKYNEKLVNENGDKLADADKTALTTKAQAVKDAIAKDDKALIDAAKEDLQKTLYEISSKLYQAAQAAGAVPGADAAGNTQAPEGNVYDADFTDVDGQ